MGEAGNAREVSRTERGETLNAARDDYELLDSGAGRKLERFGPVVLARPCAQALWERSLPQEAWRSAAASFDREDGNRWHNRSALPESWRIETAGMALKLSGTDFGHLGIFPEQRDQWTWIRETVGAAARKRNARPSVLNLFAYSGGATIAALQGGAETCHLDASRGMVQWARENAALNGLESAPARWIADDARKFLAREIRRGRRYDAVILDPPTFGRGARGELYKFERDLQETLRMTAAVLSPDPLFVLFSSHSPGITPGVAALLLERGFPGCETESGEMFLRSRSACSVPSGVFARAIFKGAAGGGANA